MLAISIVPATTDAFEAADFMQATRLAVSFATGNKLDGADTVIIDTLFFALYLEAQPAKFGLKPDSRWTGFRMPRGQQVGLVHMHEGAVARTH